MIDHTDYDFFILFNIVQRILSRIARHSPIGRKNERRRIGAKAIEKAVRREIRHAIVVNRAGESDGAWGY
ncbi:MAG: hypothetical protein ACJAYJ_001234 [Saprospiraceae bacterium]|jgi:hypothetical protein